MNSVGNTRNRSGIVLPILWLVAGGIGFARGWAVHRPGLMALGAVGIVAGLILHAIRRIDRLRHYEPMLNLVLFALTIVALLAIFTTEFFR